MAKTIRQSSKTFTRQDERDPRIVYTGVVGDWAALFEGEPVVFAARSQTEAEVQAWAWKLRQLEAGRLDA
jgi:hypothetical protein